MPQPGRILATAVTALTLVLLDAAPAAAQDEEELDRKVHSELEGDAADKVSWGVGGRLRYVFFPKGMIELFAEEAPSGVGEPGFGIEVVRRKGDFSIHLGLEHENAKTKEGYWEDSDGAVDIVEYPDGLSWTTLDATFVFHKPVHEMVALRYGAGLGLGLIHGGAEQTDAACGGPDIQNDCSPVTDPSMADDFHDDVGVPPVFPVVNIWLGAQFRPMEQLAINLEGGLRTLFFVGLSSTYFF